MSSECKTGGHCRRRKTLVASGKVSPSIVCLFLASLFVGTLVIGNTNLVAAEVERTLEDSSGSSTGADLSLVDLCIQATDEVLGDDSDAAKMVTEASDAHSNSFVSSMTNEDWSFGFSNESVKVFRDSCDYYNDVRNDGSAPESVYVIFKELTENLTMTCDMPQMKVTGKTVSFYGIADCVAANEDCRNMTSMDMAETVWENIGLECHAMTEEGSSMNGTKDESNTTKADGDPVKEGISGNGTEEQQETASEELTPGDNFDSDDTGLPFITDEDRACLNSTNYFVQGNAGLASAIASYDNSQIIKEMKNGVDSIGYPMEAAMALKSACELNKAHWAFVEKMNFTCVIDGMETKPVHLHHFGTCLVKTDDCLQFDTTDLLRLDLHISGYNCWVDDSATAPSGDGNADTESGKENGGSTQGASEDSGDAVEDDTPADLSGLTGLSDSDQKCMADTVALTMNHPTLQSAIQDFKESMIVDTGNITEMAMGFPDAEVQKLKTSCTANTIGGYFSIIDNEELDCDMMSVDVKIKLTNLADCLADTPECRSMNMIIMMEDLFKTMGITCQDKGGGEVEDSNSSTSNATKPDANDNGNENDNNGTGDGSLTQSDIACMKESTDLIDNSVYLKNATIDYERSVQMKDPTRLGYKNSSVMEMKKVCEEERGLWSVIESQDVTCVINGNDVCINVYNFGNCITNSTDCASMDPMVLVKTFFMDVLKFSCTKNCHKHKDTTGNSPSSSPPSNKHPGGYSSNNNNNFSSKQNGGTSSSSGFTLPWFVIPATVLFALITAGYFAVKKVRASRRHARVEQRRAYEMTEISDLGFKVFT